MICSRFLIPSILIAAASAQVPAPVPAPVAPVPPVAPAAPVPHAAPAPAAAPVAPVAPVPPAAAVQPFDFDFHFDMPDMAEMQERIQEAQENMQLAREKMRIDSRMLLAQNVKVRTRYESDDRLYESGLNALGNHRYDAALDNFTQVTSRGGSRADAGWYYKAYTLNKLGRRDEALAAIAELRKAYPNSRWLDDAKALELEVKQQAGRPVAPESEADDDLKLMALNGLMNSDPDRALPLVENVLKGSNSPKVKERALYVLAVNNSPKAQAALEQIARGGGNPDLQLKAINYIGTLRRRRQGDTPASTPAILPEIYGSTSDVNVKRAILNAYMANRDVPRLAEVARNEKDPNLRRDAFVYLGQNNGQPELWQIYQSETSPEVKQQILQCMYNNGNPEKLAEVARTEKDPNVRRTALRVLANQRTPASGDSLVAIYNAEQDQQNKREIINSLHSRNNCKALVDITKSEKDQKMKLYLVERLSNMKCKEASDYLAEILSK